MFSKKLLTLACVVGILAFGGCIFIPTGGTPPPPPPISWHGIQTIQVTVTNASESHHLGPAALAQAVVNNINFNSRTANAGIKAKLQTEGETGDALLKITILSETATPPPGESSRGTVKWTVLLKVSTTLTKRDGQVVWSETGADYTLTPAYPREDPDDLWQEHTLEHWLTYQLSDRLLNRMISAK
jgi:hypothetical protein